MMIERIADYQIIRELARGGQGIVYHGFHPSLKINVAIKILIDSDPQNLKRFKQEARVLDRIKHPNLLQVIDFGEYLNPKNNFAYPYMVMEYIEGTDLKSLLSTKGIPDLPWTLKIISIIAEVLDVIHQAGIVHRDLKPANILLEKGTNRPVLIDFGLIKRDPKKLALGSLDLSRLSRSGEIMGTPSFMPPEQIDTHFGGIGPWTDVYGLAATLFYLVTREAPYQGGQMSIFAKLMGESPPPDPRQFNPAIPNYLAEAIMAAMQKEAKLRPQNMQSFMVLLQSPSQRVSQSDTMPPPQSETLPPPSRHTQSQRYTQSLPKPQRKLRRFSRRKAWVSALLGTGMAGLVAYLMSQGLPRKQAVEIAREEIHQTEKVRSSTITSPPAPSTKKDISIVEFINKFSSAYLKIINLRQKNLSFDKELEAFIEDCGRAIEMYPNYYRFYYTRSGARNELASSRYQQHRNYSEIRHRLQEARQDLETALNLMEKYGVEASEDIEAWQGLCRDGVLELDRNELIMSRDAFREAIDLTNKKKFQEVLEPCNQIIGFNLPKDPSLYEIYILRANTYYLLANDSERTTPVQRKELLRKAEKDLEIAAQTIPQRQLIDPQYTPEYLKTCQQKIQIEIERQNLGKHYRARRK